MLRTFHTGMSLYKLRQYKLLKCLQASREPKISFKTFYAYEALCINIAGINI
jgi:hypothetical protein